MARIVTNGYVNFGRASASRPTFSWTLDIHFTFHISREQWVAKRFYKGFSPLQLTKIYFHFTEMGSSELEEEKMTPQEVNEFEWIQLRQKMGFEEMKDRETIGDKFARKTRENPFVPIGCGLTAGALIYGLWSLKSGQKKMSQTMMRVRIGAQGFTVLALLVGITMSNKAWVLQKHSCCDFCFALCMYNLTKTSRVPRTNKIFLKKSYCRNFY